MACTSLLLLAVISFIPPITVGGVKLRRASILSDVIDHSDGQEQHSTELVELPEIDVKEFEVDLIEVAQKVAETTASASPLGEATSASWEGIFDEQPSGGDLADGNEQMPAACKAFSRFGPTPFNCDKSICIIQQKRDSSTEAVRPSAFPHRSLRTVQPAHRSAPARLPQRYPCHNRR